MKKLLKAAAVLAAFSLMFGFASCNHDEPTSGPEQTPSQGGDGGDTGGDYTGDPTEDRWDFTNRANEIWVNPDVAGSLVEKDTTDKSGTPAYDKDGTYFLTADASVPGANNVLTLTLSSADKINYSYQAGSTDGLRFKNDALKITGVKGKVALKIEWSCIANKAADDRHLNVTIGSNPVDSVGNAATTGAATTNVAMPAYEKEFNAGSGTDIVIGCDNNLFVKTITITKQADSFTASTNSDTANNLATLGLVGTTVTSSDATIATAELADGKIKVTSVKAGAATVTVKNADEKTSEIPVTVKSSGEIEIRTIKKFTREAPVLVADSKENADSSATPAKLGKASATWDDLTDLEYAPGEDEDFVSAEELESAGITVAVDKETKTVTVSGLPAGTYGVRGKATDAYEATPALKITIGDESVAVASYTLDMATATFTTPDAEKKYLANAEINGMTFEVFGSTSKAVPDTQNNMKVANMGGAVAKDKNYIKFTTTATSSVTVNFFQSNVDRSIKIMNEAGDVTRTGEEKTTADKAVKETTFTNLPAGTYYVGSSSSGIYITKVVVTAE